MSKFFLLRHLGRLDVYVHGYVLSSLNLLLRNNKQSSLI